MPGAPESFVCSVTGGDYARHGRNSLLFELNSGNVCFLKDSPECLTL